MSYVLLVLFLNFSGAVIGTAQVPGLSQSTCQTTAAQISSEIAARHHLAVPYCVAQDGDNDRK